jgi:TRAP transporter TAXI family solute receptor
MAEEMRRAWHYRSIVVTCLATAFVAAIGCTVKSSEASPHHVVRLAVGSPLLADAYRKLMPDLSFEIVATGGSVTQLEALQSGLADVGNAMADVAYMAWRGQLGESPEAFDHLRGMAVWQTTQINVLVSPRSRVKSIAEFRGLHVALGAPGSETVLAANLLLGAFGLSANDLEGEYLPFREAGDQLARSELDAEFISSRYPSENVARATSGGARFLDVAGPPVDRLRQEYPFMRKALIPAGAYSEGSPAVHTVAVDNLILCRADLDEHLVYTLTKTLLDALPFSSARIGPFPQFDLRLAPATPILLHIGSARYYRERELLQ